MIRRFFIALVFSLTSHPVWADDVVIFAASSLKSALDEITAELPVRVSYGGSGLLARQIIQGAPADIFFSANDAWMDAAEQSGAINSDTKIKLLSNSIVFVGTRGTSFEDAIAGKGHVATGLVRSVPVGIYAKTYLETTGHWDAVTTRLIETDSARAALALVARGEVPHAIVYASDAAEEKGVDVLHTWPETVGIPIRYPVALTSRAAPEAAEVMKLLTSDMAKDVFSAHGFGIP